MPSPLTFCTLCDLRAPYTIYDIESMIDNNFNAISRAFLSRTDDEVARLHCSHYKCFTCDDCCGIECVLHENGKDYKTFCMKGLVKQSTIPAEKIQTYRTDEIKVFSAVCSALALTLLIEKITQNLSRIAVYTPRMGRSIGIYFSFNITRMIPQILANSFSSIPSPFIILTPNLDCLSPTIMHGIQEKGSKIFRLDDCLSINDIGEVSLSVPRSSVLTYDESNFSSQVEPHFDVPPGTTWNNISIHFINNKTCTITIRKQSTTRLLTEMGFKDGDKQSELFLAFANCDGVLPSTEILHNPYMKQQLYRLKLILQKYFNMKGPITLSLDKSKYICNFKLTPDTRSTKYHPRHN